MRIIAAYMLAVLGGNANPDKAAITKILASVGANGDDERIEKLLKELNGKDLDALIAEGTKKIGSVPSGGGGGAPAAAAPAAGGGGAPKKEAPKEAAKAPEPEPEPDDAGMGMSLFD